MATTRPFAYNTGSTIDGTIQLGNIAIGVSEQDYSQNPYRNSLYHNHNQYVTGDDYCERIMTY